MLLNLGLLAIMIFCDHQKGWMEEMAHNQPNLVVVFPCGIIGSPHWASTLKKRNGTMILEHAQQTSLPGLRVPCRQWHGFALLCNPIRQCVPLNYLHTHTGTHRHTYSVYSLDWSRALQKAE